MVIRYDSPVYNTDFYVVPTFSMILNALILCRDPAEANRQLLRLSTYPDHLNPRNYFKWGFEGSRLWLQQRVGYKAEAYFSSRLLTVLQYSSFEELHAVN